ncbi:MULTISPECIES: hypothetical protein [Xanthomonas]|uniref:Uncharacterized protein n=1 Tax=Xanthomonas dyei TaxID=743699 RepID=A0ABZ0D8V9_9XANT|nr:hypothetical protein [Xanthomonas dyei]MCC4632753.1 hypothetical protein [Xanthomonas dyei pv. eucalypti]WOB26217.1 hypothetical protein NYR99_21635 [Xanthomonas dyei]WOB53839.1 hypothetical protein NYR95_21640 [Xanthomonas dyei]
MTAFWLEVGGGLVGLPPWGKGRRWWCGRALCGWLLWMEPLVERLRSP